MCPRLLISFHLLLFTILSSEAVKIGISKTLAMTTTQSSNTTSFETTTEEVTTEMPTTTRKTTTTTTAKTTNSEPEWPEFPPKKTTKPQNKTTQKPNITAIKPTINSIQTNEVINTTEKPEIPKIFHKWKIPEKYCFCDLNMDACDINCCCDRDCSIEAIKVFRCLKAEPVEMELHEGRFENFKFQHGLPSCEINDGWLCVFRTYKPIIKEEVSVTYSDSSNYYKWPILLLEVEDTENGKFYKYGDLLKIINIDTKEIHNFDLPSSFKAPYCQIREPIFHLKSFKRSCLISTYEKLYQIQQDLLQLQENFKIFIKPTTPDDLYHDYKNMEIHTGNITIQRCNEITNKCLQYKHSIEIENVDLKKVKVNILHNFTNTQCVVIELWFKDNDALEEELDKEYWLEYEVEFLNKTIKELTLIPNSKNINLNQKIISGPLGYLQGKPLLFAKYVPFNNSLPLSFKNQVLNYFHANNTESNILTLFNKHQGFCKHLKDSKDQISFGINVAKQCKIRLQNDTLLTEDPSKTNFTQICLTLQKLIHEQLFGNDIQIVDISSYFISQLGKPQNISNKWVNLEVLNADFNLVFGQYLEDSNTFICRNILLSLSYEFHMATYMVDGVPLQNVLKHAVLHLGERHDLEFALDENLEVPIILTVRFYDVHEKAVSASYNLRISIVELIILLSLVLNI